MLTEYVGARVAGKPGRQYVMDADYFRRIDAMHFVLAHDDGQGESGIAEADVILVGVSRSSKTPTCFYLANRGIKAANIPLVPGSPLPVEVDLLTRPLIVGLTKDPDRLVQIRRNRLEGLNADRASSYVDQDAVRDETIKARRAFERRGWPVIDVTRRSVEETAAAVVNLLLERRARVEAGR